MWNPSLPAAWALFGKYKSHLKQLDADWQVASCRAEVHINCSCIMLRVRFSAHWKFFYVWGEQVAVDHNWEASANSDLQVYLLANEKEKTLKKTQHNPTKKKENLKETLTNPTKTQKSFPNKASHCMWVGCGFVGFFLVAAIHIFFCVYCCIVGLVKNRHVAYRVCYLTEFPMPFLLVIIMYLWAGRWHIGMCKVKENAVKSDNWQ